MKNLLLVVALGGAVFSFAAGAQASEPDLETLAGWMTGSFSSQAQAAADSNYFNISLEMARMWPDRDDGVWIYVEQAVASSRERPYRQRVYRVTQIEPDLFKSEIFTMEEALTYAGAYAEEEPLKDLTPEDLELRGGCAVFLRWEGSGETSGSTIGRGCLSSLRGAAYATSEVIISQGRIESWDRGFDADGVQVWGAENGAYIFLAE